MFELFLQHLKMPCCDFTYFSNLWIRLSFIAANVNVFVDCPTLYFPSLTPSLPGQFFACTIFCLLGNIWFRLGTLPQPFVKSWLNVKRLGSRWDVKLLGVSFGSKLLLLCAGLGSEWVNKQYRLIRYPSVHYFLCCQEVIQHNYESYYVQCKNRDLQCIYHVQFFLNCWLQGHFIEIVQSPTWHSI